MEENSRSGIRVIEFSEAAALDFAGIDNATAQQWGDVQAERYIAFLRETFAHLAQESTLGMPVGGRPGFLVFIAKYNRRRSAHGHRIFYSEIENGILIIRILHTAMNWPDILSGQAGETAAD